MSGTSGATHVATNGVAGEWQRPGPTAPAVRNDVLLALALAAGSVVSVQLMYSGAAQQSLGWRGIEAYLWAVGIAVALAARRVFPVTVMVVVSALFYGVGERLGLISGAIGIQACAFMAVYAAWAWARRRRALRWATALVFIAMAVWIALLIEEAASTRQPSTDGWFDPYVANAIYTVVLNVVYFFGAMFWGLVSWRRAREHVRVQEQAAQLARDRDLKAERAVTDERFRIARDLHDVVAHHVSSIGVHAAGARRLLERDPARSAEALRTIEQSSRAAVDEMQRLVAMLRLDDAREPGEQTQDRAPQPGLGQLDQLVERARTEGQEVRLRSIGDPCPVSRAVALSLYRTVQESLSNARKHADGAQVDVVVRYLGGADGQQVEVEVVDDGSGAGSVESRDDEGGWGLVGIRERAAMHGGTTEIGPRPDSGFRVRVRLPAGAAV